VPSHPYRTDRGGAAIDDDRDDAPRGHRGLLWRLLARRPRDTIGIGLALTATGAVLVNALYLQPGPHPAPILTVRSRPVVTTEPTGSIMLPRPRPADLAKPDPSTLPRPRADIVSDIQRELERRGFYEGPVDGVQGPKTDAAVQDFADAAGLKLSPDPTEDLLRTIMRSSIKATPARGAAGNPARPDPIANLIAAPSKRVMAVQRALTDYGYGPIKPTGIVGPETRAGIERFERERKLPITGQLSDRVLRELSAMTGRSLE
jgi:peptidoglycan hydrolase-like protein with peptidoglycan-binding domain